MEFIGGLLVVFDIYFDYHYFRCDQLVDRI